MTHHSFLKTAASLLCVLSLILLCACGARPSAPAETPAPETPAPVTQPAEAAPTPIPVESIQAPANDPAEDLTAQDNPFQELDAELAEIKASALALEEELSSADLTQTELNEKAGELYALWDNELNVIWKSLQEKLSPDAMKLLTEEETHWLQNKEQQVKDASADYEGGSIYPLISASTGARLTEERVYQLADYLRYGY